MAEMNVESIVRKNRGRGSVAVFFVNRTRVFAKDLAVPDGRTISGIEAPGFERHFPPIDYGRGHVDVIAADSRC